MYQPVTIPFMKSIVRPIKPKLWSVRTLKALRRLISSCARPRHLEGDVHRLPGRRGGVQHEVAVARVVLQVVELRHRLERTREDRLLGDVGNPSAVEVNARLQTLERFDILHAGPCWHTCSSR